VWDGPAPYTVGTPPQQFLCHFDTGSSDLILPTTDCKNCSSNLFDESASSTFVSSTDQFSTQFADLTAASGLLGFDTVTVAGLSVANQGFGALSSSNITALDSCIFGLAFNAVAQTNQTTWFDKLSASGQLASDVFSFFLQRNSTSGSELCIGCIDSTKYTGTVEYFPVDTAATNGTPVVWNLASGGVSVNGGNVTAGFQAIIDSGTSFIVAAAELAETVYAQLPGFTATQSGAETVYERPCSEFDGLPPVGFLFGETNFVINPQDFNTGPIAEGSEICAAALIGSGAGSSVTVGDSFFKSFYVVFDYANKQVGFAPSV